MKRLMVQTGLALLLFSPESYAQSGPVASPADSAAVSQTSCVILKRMGRMGRTESRLTHLGITGKQFRYVEGKLPEGFSFREKMNDNNVRNLQARGVQVLVLDSHYTSEDLQEARANCRGETGKASSQLEAKASPARAPALIASTTAPASKPPTANVLSPEKAPAAKAPAPKAEDSAPSEGATEAALVEVFSTPPEADLYIDEHFFGRTPTTTIILAPGDHKIAVKKSGFAVWQKRMKLPSGPTNVKAELLPRSK